MQIVYFDESGQTGTHMFDRDQPYFSLGSTCIEETEATKIIAECFPRQQGPEIKTSKLVKYARGRQNLLEFAKVIAARPDDFCAAKFGKRFVVVSKMVDWLVEPMLHDLGYDFYANDYAVKFANSAGFCFEHLIDADVSNSILADYNELARYPTTEKISSLAERLRSLQNSLQEPQSYFIRLLADGAEYFISDRDIATWQDTNEIHVAAAVDCMGFWQKRFAGPFHVVHDESVHFFKRSERWSMITDPLAEPMEISLGDKFLRLPIPVNATSEAKSHQNSSLQLCDLVAGVVSRISNDMAPDFRDFAEQAIMNGFGELTIRPLDFGTEFASGPPEVASGPDVIDRIAMATRKRDH